MFILVFIQTFLLSFILVYGGLDGPPLGSPFQNDLSSDPVKMLPYFVMNEVKIHLFVDPLEKEKKQSRNIS